MAKKKIRLTESDLHHIISESVKQVLAEKKSIRSSKVQQIINQHGGFYKDIWQRRNHTSPYINTDLHNMRDEDILGVMSQEQIQQLQQGHNVDHWRWADNYGLDIWAKQKGIQMEKGDRVETLKLMDGMFLVYVERNAEFEHSGRHGGYEDYYTKKQWRKRSRYNDGQREFVPMTSKGKAAKELRRNPYLWPDREAKYVDQNKEQKRRERLSKAIDNARQGKNEWGNNSFDY